MNRFDEMRRLCAYGGYTVMQIVRMSGVSQPTVWRYLRDRPELRAKVAIDLRPGPRDSLGRYTAQNSNGG